MEPKEIFYQIMEELGVESVTHDGVKGFALDDKDMINTAAKILSIQGNLFQFMLGIIAGTLKDTNKDLGAMVHARKTMLMMVDQEYNMFMDSLVDGRFKSYKEVVKSEHTTR